MLAKPSHPEVKKPTSDQSRDSSNVGSESVASRSELSQSGNSQNLIGGAEEDRTPDPLRARQVLSQLSYGPSIHLVAGSQIGGSGWI